MSYVTRIIGARETLQEDRLILVTEGNLAPSPATGYTVIKLYTASGKDVYLEYRVYDGPFK